MKEVTFINRNKQKWESISTQLKNVRGLTPDQLGDLYMEITNDLAYSTTFYKQSETTRYLNQLAIKIHREIYRNKKEKSSRLVSLYKTEIPLLFYKHRRYIYISLGIFLLSGLLGALSVFEDSGFVNAILGDQYVQMTLENIEKGDPMGVYGKMDEEMMFLMITMNNIFVSFLVFLFGLLTPLGTIWQLFRNGIMVGAFQTFFFEQELLNTATMAIMIHGTLELSAIVLAGAAGIALGKNIFFPGTLPRGESFRLAIREGTIMLIGLVPVFVLAGFIESYITRYYNQMSFTLNLMIIILSLTFIIGYFIVYPRRVARNINKNH